MKSHTHRVDGPAVIGLQLIKRVFIMQGHRSKFGFAAILRQNLCDLGTVIVKRPVRFIVAVPQKSHFNIIHARLDQLGQDFPNRIFSKIPVIDIPAVPEGTIQQFDI